LTASPSGENNAVSKRGPPGVTAYRNAISDLAAGMRGWRIWTVLTSNEIRKRYRRSVLGQFWYTLSMAFTVFGIGYVYGALFNQPYAEFLAYLAVSFPLWFLIANLTSDSAQVFIASEGPMKHYAFPGSTYIWQMILRNLFIFAHNIVLIIPVFLIAGKAPTLAMVMILPALAAYMLTGLWLGMLFGILGTRFRDVPQILASLTSMAFFITPVLFRPVLMPPEFRFIVDHNPFAALLAIGRDPLLGQWPRLADWGYVGLITLIGFAVAMPVYGRYRRFIQYWL